MSGTPSTVPKNNSPLYERISYRGLLLEERFRVRLPLPYPAA